jgi:hypothetical protein
MRREPNESDENIPPPAYLTRRQLADRGGVSTITIDRYKRDGKIPFSQPGGPGSKVFFPPNALEFCTVHARDVRASAEGVLVAPQPVGSSTGGLPAKRKLAGPSPRWQKGHRPKEG